MIDLNIFFKETCVLIDEKIEHIFMEAGNMPMYHMLRYFMGYNNELRIPSEGIHGKRTRSTLLLLVAKMFGGAKSAMELAAAIELFHNFTLIHDDIVDNDEMRRGQPTVWKLWGVDHAINTGDAQLLLANQCLLNASLHDPQHGVGAAHLLNAYFKEVVEGQYLDFVLTEKTLQDKMTLDEYVEMIRKKTAVLIGAASSAGGRASGCVDSVVEKLYVYGEALGLAYQLVDDYVSVWGEEQKTGKRAFGDIYERKKTYPILHARDVARSGRLVELYEKKGDMTEYEVFEIKKILEDSGAREATQKFITHHVQKAQDVVKYLPLSEKEKEVLCALVEMFVSGANMVTKNNV